MNNVLSLDRDYTQVQEPQSQSNTARKEKLLMMLRKCLEENNSLLSTSADAASPTPAWLQNLQTQVLREVDASPHLISAAQQTSSEIDDQIPESPSTPSQLPLASNLKQPGSPSKKKKVRFALPAIENPVQTVAEVSLFERLKTSSASVGSRVLTAIRRLFFSNSEEQETDIENQISVSPTKRQIGDSTASANSSLVPASQVKKADESTVQQMARGGSGILREWMKRLIKLLNIFEMLLFTFHRMRMYEWANFVLQLRGMVYNSFQLVWGLLYLANESSNGNQTVPSPLLPSTPYPYSQPSTYPYNTTAGAYPYSGYR